MLGQSRGQHTAEYKTQDVLLVEHLGSAVAPRKLLISVETLVDGIRLSAKPVAAEPAADLILGDAHAS